MIIRPLVFFIVRFTRLFVDIFYGTRVKWNLPKGISTNELFLDPLKTKSIFHHVEITMK